MPSRPPHPPSAAVAALAPVGGLRAGINLGNFLLVSGSAEDGSPAGVSPSLAAELAAAIGRPIDYVTFPGPAQVVDALGAGRLDVGNIGADPSRAQSVVFTAPYCEIEATYLVSPESPISSIDEVDRPGVRISTRRGAAYTLWLDRNIAHADVIHADTIDESFERFTSQRLEVLAGLRPRLISDAERLPGTRVLDGRFTVVEQAIGMPRDRPMAGLSFLEAFVRWAIQSGYVAELIQRHSVRGLTVASNSDG